MDKFKEKIFAISVVVALAVIFIPMLFNSDTEKRVSLAKELPQSPIVKRNNLAKPKQLETLVQTQPEGNHSQGEENKTASQVQQPLVKARIEPDEVIPKQPNENATTTQLQTSRLLSQPNPMPQAVHNEKVALTQVKKLSGVEETIKSAKTENSLLVNTKIKEESLSDWHPWIQGAQNEITLQQESEESVKEKTTLPQESIKKEVKKEKHTKNGWAVQLGSFAISEHANILVHQLKNAGYPAFTRDNNQSHLTLVLVGPHLRKEDAYTSMKALESKFKLKGILIRYSPLKIKENDHHD